MFEFDSFDMDMDGHVDGIDFLGFDCLMRHTVRRDDGEDAEEHDVWEDEAPGDC